MAAPASGGVVSSLLPIAPNAGPTAASLVASVTSAVSAARAGLAAGWGWLKEHKKAVAGGVAVTAAVGGYIVYRKVQPMIAELREQLKMMDQLAQQLNPQSSPAQKHAILLHRLEHNLSVGDLTLRQLAAQLRQDLSTRFDVDSIRARLKKSGQGGGGEEQQLLWNEFKTAGVARTVAAVYTTALLHALVKVQVSIVSRYVLFDQQAAALRAEQEAAQSLGGGGGGGAGGAGAAAGQQAGVAAASGQAGALGQAQMVLPQSACEEVNRVYFSLSRHACGLGAAALADAIAACVRLELAEQPVAAHVTPGQVDGLVERLRLRVDRDGLGLEEKESLERAGGPADAGVVPGGVAGMAGKATPATASASAAGASAASTVFATSAPFARFLLPPSASLSSLVASVSFPDPAHTSMASFRLAEMLAETNALLATQAFECAVRESARVGMDEVRRRVGQAAFAQAQQQQSQSQSQAIPFANVLIHVIKLFGVLLPDVGSSPASSASQSVASPLFHALADLPAVKELCAVIYLPADAIVQEAQQGQMTTLEQLTANRQYAGPPGPPRPSQTPLTIEEIPASDRPLAARLPMAAQLQHAVQDIKGLPTFERL